MRKTFSKYRKRICMVTYIFLILLFLLSLFNLHGFQIMVNEKFDQQNQQIHRLQQQVQSLEVDSHRLIQSVAYQESRIGEVESSIVPIHNEQIELPVEEVGAKKEAKEVNLFQHTFEATLIGVIAITEVVRRTFTLKHLF